MKLVFKKDEDSQISVLQKIGDKEKDFSYIDMIGELVQSKVLEEPEISDGFTEAEIDSINSMVDCINREISTSGESVSKS